MLGQIQTKTDLEKKLVAELTVTRQQLITANEKLEMYAAEKARFIETMRRNVSDKVCFLYVTDS